MLVTYDCLTEEGIDERNRYLGVREWWKDFEEGRMRDSGRAKDELRSLAEPSLTTLKDSQKRTFKECTFTLIGVRALAERVTAITVELVPLCHNIPKVPPPFYPNTHNNINPSLPV